VSDAQVDGYCWSLAGPTAARRCRGKRRNHRFDWGDICGRGCRAPRKGALRALRRPSTAAGFRVRFGRRRPNLPRNSKEELRARMEGRGRERSHEAHSTIDHEARQLESADIRSCRHSGRTVHARAPIVVRNAHHRPAPRPSVRPSPPRLRSDGREAPLPEFRGRFGRLRPNRTRNPAAVLGRRSARRAPLHGPTSGVAWGRHGHARLRPEPVLRPITRRRLPSAPPSTQTTPPRPRTRPSRPLPPNALPPPRADTSPATR
jgi:hypothetical protein